MKKSDVVKPIGLTNITEKIESICKNERAYKFGLRPEHLIVPLSAGCGRTTLIEYITNMFKEHGILDFSGSPDEYIEVTIDGTSTGSIKQSFEHFRAAAVYSNNYCNVAALDIEEMAKYLMAPQFADFMKEVKTLCRHAYVVFFVSGAPTSNEEKLIAKLIDSIGKNRISQLEIEKYSPEDICDLIEKAVGEYGALIEDCEMFNEFHETLMNVVMNKGISKVKDAIDMAEELIYHADFSLSIPIVNSELLLAKLENGNDKGRNLK